MFFIIPEDSYVVLNSELRHISTAFLTKCIKRSYLLFVSAGLIWHHIHRPPNVLSSQFWVRSVLIEYHYDQTAAASFCNRRISPLINIKRVFNKRPYWLLAVVQSKRASNQLKLGTQWQRQQNVALLPLRNNYICFLFIFSSFIFLQLLNIMTLQ